MPAGYSGTPLIRKLGLESGHKAVFLDAPSHYLDLLGELPESVQVLTRLGRQMDFIHYFATQETALRRRLPAIRRALALDGKLWISWAKKSSPLATDLAEGAVRSAGLDAGLVDVKICAVDEDWSGLKFVYRIEDRK